jgi:hypothetical protein
MISWRLTCMRMLLAVQLGITIYLCLGLGKKAHAQSEITKLHCEKPNTIAAKTKGSKPPAVPLPDVIAQVQKAIQCYQEDRTGDLNALPDLESAELDFKVVNDTKLGGTLSVLIFKLGATSVGETTDDVTYKYGLTPPPKPSDQGPFSATLANPNLTFDDQLANTIVEAAAAVKNNEKLDKLCFQQLTVTLQYAVQLGGSIGLTFPIELVTVGLSAEKDRNAIQGVKLVFHDAKPKQCE